MKQNYLYEKDLSVKRTTELDLVAIPDCILILYTVPFDIERLCKLITIMSQIKIKIFPLDFPHWRDSRKNINPSLPIESKSNILGVRLLFLNITLHAVLHQKEQFCRTRFLQSFPCCFSLFSHWVN